MSALDPQGPAAAEILGLFWLMLGLTGVAALATIAWFVWGAVRRRLPRHERPAPSGVSDPALERKLVLGLGVGLPVVVLGVILAETVLVGRAVDAPPPDGALLIEVIGHMFWWEVRYPDEGVVTANEIALPVGRVVALRLGSADVIHSFWVPALHGKMDMVPGRWNGFWLQADREGALRGECAEYCGVQHARMTFDVTVLDDAAFERWLAERRDAPSLPGDDPLVARGREVFGEAGCDGCHAVRGVTEDGRASRTGPDLSALALRPSLAAGALPNNRGNLAGWILDPQSHKPGNRMPETRLSVADLDALVAFLEALR